MSDKTQLRDKLAMAAPITFEVALRVWGDSDVNLSDDTTRAMFFAVWALARYEYADAMLEERLRER